MPLTVLGYSTHSNNNVNHTFFHIPIPVRGIIDAHTLLPTMEETGKNSAPAKVATRNPPDRNTSARILPGASLP